MDISELMDSANNFSANAAAGARSLFNLSIDQAVSVSADASVQTDLGLNNQIIDNAKQTADLTTQNAKIAVGNALGTNVKDQSQVMTGLSSNILDLMQQRQAAAKVVADKQSVGFFDDPLQHILNQFTVNDDIDKHNAINEQLSEATDSMDSLNRMTQQSAITQQALNEPITAAAIAASSKNTANTAALAASKAGREALAYNAQGITAALSMGREALGAQFQAQTAQVQQQNIQTALDHLTMERERFDWQKQEKTIADKARDKNTDIDAYTMSKINDGLVRMGMEPIPQNSPRAGSVLSAIKSGAANGSVYQQAFQVSNDSEAAGGATILAPSPAGAIELLSKLPLKLTPAQEPVKQLLDDSVAATKLDKSIDLKNHAMVSQSINDNAKSILATMSKEVKPGDSSNVFQIPPLGAVINAAPELQSLPLVAKVLAPMIAAGSDVSNPDIVFHAAIDAASKGIITLNDATEGIAYTYQRAVKVNLEARQLQSLGLNLTPRKPGDPSTMTFNAPITAGPKTAFSISDKQTVDMTDFVGVSRAINQVMAAQNNPFKGRTID